MNHTQDQPTVNNNIINGTEVNGNVNNGAGTPPPQQQQQTNNNDNNAVVNGVEKPPIVNSNNNNGNENNNNNVTNGVSNNNHSPTHQQQQQQVSSSSTPSQQPQQQQQQTKYTWIIPSFSHKTEPFYTSNQIIYGLTWRLYVFPKGNNSPEDVSLFLDLVDIKQPNFAAHKVNFVLEVVNQKSGENFRKPSEHTFTSKCSDWGFNKFIKQNQLSDPATGYILNDTVMITAHIYSCIADSGRGLFMFDSRKLTGFVGLKNQGATCYMNSLLQALYQISPFRKAVYELPTPDGESIPLALQRIFYKLQFGNSAVSTKELTKSFGWGTMDIFTQHDVQELNRVLCDNLNDKMKGTKAEGTIDNLFRGKIKNFIKCEQVKYESTREEYFYDLSLNVKGCPNILSSFDKYTEVEKLDGNNKYDAEGFGLQVANKGCNFLSFPPVLHLQLKRFEYDPYKDANVKVNDKYTFPEKLDLTPYLDDEADKSIPSIYILQGVLIHSGDIHNGHYYAFLKPSKEGDWLKFDDEEVAKSSFHHVSDDSFGFENENPLVRYPSVKSFTNAYMLVYLREKEIDQLLKPIQDTEIPENLKQRIESDEKKSNSRSINVFVSKDQDFSGNTFDLADFSKIIPHPIAFKQNEPFTIGYLKKQLTPIIGIPPERQRIWSWALRKNKTIRIDSTPEHDDVNILDKFKSDFKFHLEVSYTPRPLNMNDQYSYFQPIGPSKEKENALLFFKYYDPSLNRLQFVGSKVIDLYTKVSHIVPLLNTLANLPLDTPLVLYEEISEQNIEPIKPNEIFKKIDIGNGDIIVFQKPVSINEKHIYPTVVQYFDYIHHKTIVNLRQVENNNSMNAYSNNSGSLTNNTFKLELSKEMKYSQITKIIANHIKVDADKIRLLSSPRYSDVYSPIKPNDNIPLSDILISNRDRNSDQLFFEVLSIPVSECEFKRNFKIAWLKPNSGYEKISLWVNKNGNILEIKKEFMNTIQQKQKQQSETDGKSTIASLQIERLRLLEIRSHKIERELKDEMLLGQIMDMSNLKMEIISDEEINMNPTDKLVSVVHFSNENNIYCHGIPFQFVVKSGENYASLRARLFTRLYGVSQGEFARWKIALIQPDKIDIMDENSVIREGGDWSQVLIGLQHNPTSSYKYQQKAIKINK